jgi:lysyl-tRNA synthetase class 2
MPKIFELNRNFRNEGISPRHNPEFTMLEVYEAYGNWETMADLIEEMICHIAMTLFGSLKIIHRRGAEAAEKDAGRIINLERPWRRATMAELVEEKTGWKFDKRPLKEQPEKIYWQVMGKIALSRVKVAQEFMDALSGKLSPAEKAQAEKSLKTIESSSQSEIEKLLPRLDSETKAKLAFAKLCETFDDLDPSQQLVEVYEKLVEPTLIDPCFVTQVPSVIIPLARESKTDPFFADVYELAINGQEISPGYTELNDPEIQAKHFAHQVGNREEQQKVDEDFLTALKYGMPPAGGLGMGVDRLVAMLTGAESLRDVILFPLMRPQEK